MTIELALIEQPDDFPNPNEALDDPNGLLGFGALLTQPLLKRAYYEGIFPWYNAGEPVFWWSPDPRAAFYPYNTLPSRNLRKRLRRRDFKVCINRSFSQVISACASQQPNRPDTWITDEMQHAYVRLHQSGLAHSFEVYNEDQLVGGLYGVSIGQMFFGESMFHRMTDASKIALFYLIKFAAFHQFAMIDCQMPNAHLLSLGAKEVSRNEFLRYLYQYRDSEMPSQLWNMRDITEDFEF